jgi:hypothetical protein
MFTNVEVDKLGNARTKPLPLALEPNHKAASGLGLTVQEMSIITGDRPQIEGLVPEESPSACWAYEWRRKAQPILDFLWVGPSSVTKDHEFLRSRGISMILVANEMRLPGQRLRSIEVAAETVGVRVEYVDTQAVHQRVAVFEKTLHIINNHILEWYRTKHEDNALAAPAVTGPDSSSPTVLVVCESGNDRSVAIVASYIMAMYSRNHYDAVRYIVSRRLSCAFDDNSKRALQTWDDILRAKAVVSSQATKAAATACSWSSSTRKRRIGGVTKMDIEGGNTGDEGPEDEDMMDHDRFAEREAFTPFKDIS